jgi:hypothetical protein
MLRPNRSQSPHQSMAERRFGAPDARIEWLERRCRAMRAKALASHWPTIWPSIATF